MAYFTDAYLAYLCGSATLIFAAVLMMFLTPYDRGIQISRTGIFYFVVGLVAELPDISGSPIRRVQLYSRDKTDWTVQSWKLSYSRENSADIDLKLPLYIYIGRSIQILWVVVKLEKRFWKQWPIYMLLVCLYFAQKIVTHRQDDKMSFSLFPRPSFQVYIFYV